MSDRIYKTKINGVPIKFKLLGVDKKSLDNIDELDKILKKGFSESVKPVESVSAVKDCIKIVKAGDKEHPVSDKESEEIEKTINKPELMIEILKGIQSEKNWWESKTVWANILALLGSVFTVVGLDINIDTETHVLLITSLLGSLNVVLRVFTDKPIKH